MKRLLCTHSNASTNINGISFEKTDDGMLSGPVEDSVAARFEDIPYWKVLDIPAPKSPKANDTAKPSA